MILGSYTSVTTRAVMVAKTTMAIAVVSLSIALNSALSIRPGFAHLPEYKQSSPRLCASYPYWRLAGNKGMPYTVPSSLLLNPKS